MRGRAGVVEVARVRDGVLQEHDGLYIFNSDLPVREVDRSVSEESLEQALPLIVLLDFVEQARHVGVVLVPNEGLPMDVDGDVRVGDVGITLVRSG